MFSLALCRPFSIVIDPLGEEGAVLCAARACVCLFYTRKFFSFFSSSWCQGLAVTCAYGTLWTFYQLVYAVYRYKKQTL